MPLIPLRRLLAGVLFCGLIGSIVLTALQQLDAHPQLIQSEHVETRIEQAQPSHGSHPPTSPEQRLKSLAFSNWLLSTGFSALLFSILYLHSLKSQQLSSATTGVIAGMLGYLMLFVLPTNLIPPSTVGGDILRAMAGKEHSQHQLWLLTIGLNLICTLLILWGTKSIKLAALAAIIALQILAPPYQFTTPTSIDTMTGELIQGAEEHYRFSLQITNLLYWLSLGLFTGVTLAFLQQDKLNQPLPCDPEQMTKDPKTS